MHMPTTAQISTRGKCWQTAHDSGSFLVFWWHSFLTPSAMGPRERLSGQLQHSQVGSGQRVGVSQVL